MAEDALRIIEIQQQCSDGISAHRADPVREHEPTRLSFDR
jgi:hypothetical protein